MRANVNYFLTEEINITNGVLQCDSLSPTWFAIFINDYMNQHGARRVGIHGVSEVGMWSYADDIVLIADTPSELRKKLSPAMEAYTP